MPNAAVVAPTAPNYPAMTKADYRAADMQGQDFGELLDVIWKRRQKTRRARNHPNRPATSRHLQHRPKRQAGKRRNGCARPG